MSHAPHPSPEPLVNDTVLHDLMNPMTAILGNIQLLQDLMSEAPSPRCAARLGAARQSVEDLAGMLDNLRWLMQWEARPSPPAVAPVAVGALLEGLRAWHGSREVESGSALECRCHEDRATVLGTADLLQRVMRGVLAAATRVARDFPIVVESQSVDPKIVRIAFTYRGKPLTEAMIATLFERTPATGGAKIDRARGLYFAKIIVIAHQGAIHYEPQGQGGRFVIDLPAARVTTCREKESR